MSSPLCRLAQLTRAVHARRGMVASIGVIAGASGFISPTLAQPAYKATPIPLLPGATEMRARAVNNRGDVVGRAVVGTDLHGFVYLNGTLIDLGVLGPQLTSAGALGINDAQKAVGVMRVGGTDHAFVWTNAGGIVDVTFNPDSVPIVSGQAVAISNSGLVAGSLTFACDVSTNYFIACRWVGGGVIDELPVFNPCGQSIATGINESGVIAGSSQRYTEFRNWNRPVTWDGFTLTDLGTFSTTEENGVAYDVNDLGVVCGYAEDRTQFIALGPPVKWENNSIVRLNPPGSFGDAFPGQALGINNSGRIVGELFTSFGVIGWMWDQGTLYPLEDTIVPDFDWQFTSGAKVADTGYVAASGYYQGGFLQAALLEPCEPGFVMPTIDPATVGSTITIDAIVGAAKPASLQWRYNGVPISNGATINGSVISGATSSTLVITNAQSADAGNYTLVVNGTCGTGTSPAVVVVVNPLPACVADVDNGSGTGTPDGGVTIDDLLYYLSIFNIGDVSADVDDGTGNGTPDGGITIDDLLYFLTRFNLGC